MSEKGGPATSRGANTVASPLKWHPDGGKHYLAAKIVALMPPHTHYVEPFCGGLSVLLAKDPEGVSEVANDLSGQLTNFWGVLQHAQSFGQFRRIVEAVPFSEEEWESAECMGARRVAFRGTPLPVAKAVDFFVRCRQSLAGRMESFAPLSRTRTRRGMNEQVAAWLSAVEGLPAVHARLKRVVVLNRDALDVIRQQDGPDTLFYCDPPYLHETRASKDAYAHEMTREQHEQLLSRLAVVAGKFLLSGYPSDLYTAVAAERGWHRVDFDLPNNSAGGKAKRRMTESVWTNYEPAAKTDAA